MPNIRLDGTMNTFSLYRHENIIIDVAIVVVAATSIMTIDCRRSAVAVVAAAADVAVTCMCSTSQLSSSKAS
jgi:hypothetical protein